ncbi:acyl-CoA synthetase family member 2, mitochondrial-like [Lingula anatina]|uniref:Acyl-CoA synthetase family member 2, mitochondrial-like n=1 Tax=Lingula anatina TaxID=7574 RepID=A0A1S3JAR2_LINAN|nr:acyl-CoA synthetase family member 2, mitochondrial-like [Lingula anatina]|eukprot:XP_013407413.1 acyl-CoA synthetase family member 2, mitochondrial-like [Lingula anatina]
MEASFQTDQRSGLSYVYKLPNLPQDSRIIPDYLDDKVKEHPERQAAVYYPMGGGKSCITYRQLQDQSVQLAAGLIKTGLKVGECVLLIAPNCLEYIVIEMACARIGVCLIFQKFGSPATDAVEMAKSTGCSAVIVCAFGSSALYGESIVQEWQKTPRDGSTDPPLAICAGFKATEGNLSYEDLVRPNELASAEEIHTVFEVQSAVQMEDPLLALMTSGSTGKPKVVLYNHFQFINVLRASCFTLPNVDGARYFNDRPFSWAVGAMLGTYLIPFSGITLVFLDPEISVRKGDGVMIRNILQDERCTHAFLMAYIMYDLIHADAIPEYGLSLVEYALSAGQPLVKEMTSKFMAKFPNVLLGQTYGCTEFGPFAFQTYSMVADTDHVSFNCLEMAPNTEAKVVNSDGRLVTKNTVGELLLRGPHLFERYVTNEEGTKAACTPQHWFKTGDLVTMNDDGCIRFVARMSDAIKRAAVLIYPVEVEMVISKHPDVDQVVVVGVPDERFTQELCACVILTHSPGSSEERLDTIKEWTSDQFPPGPDGLSLSPKYFISFQDFPKTANGKTSRRDLTKIAAETYGC